MSQPPSDLEAALRTVTHDVRSALGVLFSAVDELSHEAAERGVLAGRVSDLLAMMRRSARRLEILADATELARQHGGASPPSVRIDLGQLARDAAAARIAVERAEPLLLEVEAPSSAHARVVVPWCRYVCGEAVGFVARRARQRLTLSIVEAGDAWVLSVTSDAPSRPGPIGPPFLHPLGLAASLAHDFGGTVEIVAAETAHVVIRVPK